MSERERPFGWFASNRKYIEDGSDVWLSVDLTREFQHITKTALHSYLYGVCQINSSCISPAKFHYSYLKFFQSQFCFRRYKQEFLRELMGRIKETGSRFMEEDIARKLPCYTPQRFLHKIIRAFGLSCLLCKKLIRKPERDSYPSGMPLGSIVFGRMYGDLKYWGDRYENIDNPDHRSWHRVHNRYATWRDRLSAYVEYNPLCANCEEVATLIGKRIRRKKLPDELFLTEILLYATQGNNKFFHRTAA